LWKAQERSNLIYVKWRDDAKSERVMAWHGWERDPMTDQAAPSVLAAYDAAFEARWSTVQCYLAGVRAWRQMHPDQTPGYAAQRAVAVIIEAKISLRIADA
jgi:hypothetical protein